MSRDDSIYQQLRSHLTYLNLTAAAEALPGQLEAARTAKAGHTEFLEALLRIEVEATEQRRWEGRMRFANFPAPWRVDDFDFTAQPS
ncbi:MAG: AAA family ATPase, partial [Actinobacteria bacterium]|nr:AAA family ATPase [Actinomycetota bacterium]